MVEIVTIAAQALVLMAAPDPSMYSERLQAGDPLPLHGSVILCSPDARDAVVHAESIVMELGTVGRAAAESCRRVTDRTWRVVRVLASRCMAHDRGEWCEAESHAVLVESRGERRYAVAAMTADQVD